LVGRTDIQCRHRYFQIYKNSEVVSTPKINEQEKKIKVNIYENEKGKINVNLLYNNEILTNNQTKKFISHRIVKPIPKKIEISNHNLKRKLEIQNQNPQKIQKLDHIKEEAEFLLNLSKLNE
jgi:hypothetical protein